jgi:outer membrane immunogenic protein
LETDFQVSGISGSKAGLRPDDTLDTYTLKGSLDWFGTVRGRLGYAFGPALLYATGGFAYGRVENDITYSSAFPQVCCGYGPSVFAVGTTHGSSIEAGYVVGGGLEYLVAPKWTLKAEYQFIDLGSHTASTKIFWPGDPLSLNAKVDNNYSTVRLGLNYHIGDAGYVPLK